MNVEKIEEMVIKKQKYIKNIYYTTTEDIITT